jgi:pilus assembly protein CpaE
MPSTSVPVVVLDDDQAVRGRLAMQLGERADAGASLDVAAAGLDGEPRVVVLGPSFADPRTLASVQAQLGHRSEVGTVLVVEQLTTDLLQQALRLGVKDVLTAPVETGALAEAVDRVASTLQPSAPRGDVFTPPAPEPSPDRGNVITVFSTKGGAGKSVVAANMAVSFAKRSDKPVVLVDADLQFGDVAVMLKLAPQHTIVDAVGSLDRLDPNLLQQFLVRHEPSGLYVLAAPLEPSFADQISAGEMVKIIEMLRGFCSWVVVDTPAYFNEVVLGIIEESDDVLLIAGMDIPNIKNVKIGLQTLRLLSVPMSKLHLILNRANSKVKLDVGEVERTLQVKAEALIPSDVVVPQSVNKGTPVVLDAPKSGVAKSIEQLVSHFYSKDEARRR